MYHCLCNDFYVTCIGEKMTSDQWNTCFTGRRFIFVHFVILFIDHEFTLSQLSSKHYIMHILIILIIEVKGMSLTWNYNYNELFWELSNIDWTEFWNVLSTWIFKIIIMNYFENCKIEIGPIFGMLYLCGGMYVGDTW